MQPAFHTDSAKQSVLSSASRPTLPPRSRVSPLGHRRVGSAHLGVRPMNQFRSAWLKILVNTLLGAFATCAQANAPSQDLTQPPDLTDRTPSTATLNGALLSAYSLRGTAPVRSWKSIRDERVVKQTLDFSCGAASLATLFNALYGKSFSEELILAAIGNSNSRASFENMSLAVQKFGFKGLADPSHGNRTYSREQFLAMWQTRRDPAAPELAGKFLAVLPMDPDFAPHQDYFMRTPRRQTANATRQLAIRYWMPN